MQLSNFKLIEVIGNSPITWKFRAKVDVTIRISFGLTNLTTERYIYKNYGGAWFFTDTGEFTPDNDVENLVRVFEAKNGRNLEFCDIPEDKETT